MGQKTAMIVLVLAAVSIILQVVTVFLPMHLVDYYMTVINLFNMNTYLLGVKVKPGDMVCKVAKSLCAGIDTVHDLQPMSQRFCTLGTEAIFPGMCQVLQSSHTSGLAVVVCYGINTALLLAACYLVADYTLRSRKQQYRMTALILFAVGTVIEAGALLAYGFTALSNLYELHAPGGPILGLLVTPSGGAHTSVGYYMAWLSVLVQLVAMALFGVVRSGDELDEETLREIKAQKAFEAGEIASQAESWSTQQAAPLTGGPGFGGPGYDAGYGPGYAAGYGAMGAAPPMGGVCGGAPAPPPGAMPPPPMMPQGSAPQMQPAW